MKNKTMKDQHKRQMKRFDPVERRTITNIFSLIEEHFDIELALTVSLQLQEYAKLIKVREEYKKEIHKKDFERLREIADCLENWDMDH